MGGGSDTNSSTVCRLLFYILTSANRIPDPAPLWRRCTKSAVELSAPQGERGLSNNVFICHPVLEDVTILEEAEETSQLM